MKKIYFLLGAFMFVGGASAQLSPQYKLGSDVKHAKNAITWYDNRDEVNIDPDRATYYTEDFDGGLGTWTNTIITGGVGFESTSTGHANDAGSTFIIPALNTSTSTAWVLLDSDSDGTSGTEELAYLESATIDLSGSLSGGEPLKLEMEQFYAGWQSDTIFLDISDDDGASWTRIEIENNSIGREGRPNPEIVSINITPYIADPSQIKLRFVWHGNWDYGWQLDNVSILDLPMHDLTLSSVFRADWVNAYVYSQVPDEQAVEFVIGADIKNIGFEDITNIGFDWEILDPAMAVAASGTSGTLASLANGENDTVWVSTGFTPTDLGQYTINYTIVSDSTEDAADLAGIDMTDDYYELTDWTYGADYGPINVTGFNNWSGNDAADASIGTVFSFPNNGVVGGIEAQLRDDASVVDQLIYHQMNYFDAGAGEWQVWEITDDYTTTAADQGQIVTLYFDDPVSVTAGDFWMGAAGHYGGEAAWAMAGSVPEGQTAGFNASATGLFSSLINPTAPVVRLLMHDFTTLEEEQPMEFSVYPNPATSEAIVSMKFANAENTVVTVTDLSGKTVKTIEVGSVHGGKSLQLDVNDLNSGVYFIKVSSTAGELVEKFVKK